jgi:hypothetical protein
MPIALGQSAKRKKQLSFGLLTEFPSIHAAGRLCWLKANFIPAIGRLVMIGSRHPRRRKLQVGGS